MTLAEMFKSLQPYQKVIIALLPIAGIVIGWLLKTLTDVFLRAKDDWSKRRECIFYLLQTWKNILDFERYISHLSKQDIDIEKYEQIRADLAKELKERLISSKASLKTGIVSLASVDPTAAAQLDNTLKNFLKLLSYNFTDLLSKDEAMYRTFNIEFYKQIDWTVSDISFQAEKLAAKAGPLQKRRTSKWFDDRIKGGEEFREGVTEILTDAENGRPNGSPSDGATSDPLRVTFEMTSTLRDAPSHPPPLILFSLGLLYLHVDQTF
jgi:hypothetical protein